MDSNDGKKTRSELHPVMARRRAISSILSEYDEKGTWEEISAVSEAKGRAEGEAKGAWDLAIRYYRSGHSSAEVTAETLGVSVQEFFDGTVSVKQEKAVSYTGSLFCV